MRPYELIQFNGAINASESIRAPSRGAPPSACRAHRHRDPERSVSLSLDAHDEEGTGRPYTAENLGVERREVRLVNVLEREGVHIRIVEAVVAEEEGRGLELPPAHCSLRRSHTTICVFAVSARHVLVATWPLSVRTRRETCSGLMMKPNCASRWDLQAPARWARLVSGDRDSLLLGGLLSGTRGVK